MVPATKSHLMIDSESITAAETASGTVDTKDFNFLSIDISLGTVAATSNKPTTFQLVESDDNTTFATFSGFVAGTDYTIPAGDSSTTQTMKFDVNLLGRRRYIGLQIASRATQLCTAFGNLSRASETPTNASEAGVDLLVQG